MNLTKKFGIQIRVLLLLKIYCQTADFSISLPGQTVEVISKINHKIYVIIMVYSVNLFLRVQIKLVSCMDVQCIMRIAINKHTRFRFIHAAPNYQFLLTYQPFNRVSLT